MMPFSDVVDILIDNGVPFVLAFDGTYAHWKFDDEREIVICVKEPNPEESE